MRKRVVLLAVCLMAIVSVAAQTQTGYVKTKGRLARNGSVIAGKRLSGASVQVKGQTSAQRSVVSNTNGDFSFPVPSQEFYLQSVKKSGYVLNDPEQLKKQYAYSKNPLVVVLVTPSEQLDEQLSAERKARRALTRELQRKEDELEMLKEENKISLEQYRVQLQELYQKQEDNEKLIKDMAERYSKIDYDALDDFGREFSTYFLNGDFDKADSLVNTKGDINVAVAKLKQLRDELEKKKRLEQYESEEIARLCNYNLSYSKCVMRMTLLHTTLNSEPPLTPIIRHGNL